MENACAYRSQALLVTAIASLIGGCYIRDRSAVDPREQPRVWVAAQVIEGAEGAGQKLERAPATGATPTSPVVPDAQYRPTGRGPVPFETRGEWHVVEAGQRWRVTPREGKAIDGVVVAVSSRAIAIDPGTGAEVVVASTALDDLQRL